MAKKVVSLANERLTSIERKLKALGAETVYEIGDPDVAADLFVEFFVAVFQTLSTDDHLQGFQQESDAVAKPNPRKRE